MASIKVLSWNVNGLNARIKRTMCLDYLYRHHIDVAFIQESKLQLSHVKRFANRQYYTVASSSFDSKSRGSLVVLKRNRSLSILGKFSSSDGRIA